MNCYLFCISEYVDEGMLIPKNTSVLIRRVPGRPRMPIVAAPPITDQQQYYFETFKLLNHSLVSVVLLDYIFFNQVWWPMCDWFT